MGDIVKFRNLTLSIFFLIMGSKAENITVFFENSDNGILVSREILEESGTLKNMLEGSSEDSLRLVNTEELTGRRVIKCLININFWKNKPDFFQLFYQYIKRQNFSYDDLLKLIATANFLDIELLLNDLLKYLCSIHKDQLLAKAIIALPDELVQKMLKFMPYEQDKNIYREYQVAQNGLAVYIDSDDHINIVNSKQKLVKTIKNRKYSNIAISSDGSVILAKSLSDIYMLSKNGDLIKKIKSYCDFQINSDSSYFVALSSFHGAGSNVAIFDRDGNLVNKIDKVFEDRVYLNDSNIWIERFAQGVISKIDIYDKSGKRINTLNYSRTYSTASGQPVSLIYLSKSDKNNKIFINKLYGPYVNTIFNIDFRTSNECAVVGPFKNVELAPNGFVIAIKQTSIGNSLVVFNEDGLVVQEQNCGVNILANSDLVFPNELNIIISKRNWQEPVVFKRSFKSLFDSMEDEELKKELGDKLHIVTEDDYFVVRPEKRVRVD